MAEAREDRFVHFSPCASERGGRNTSGKARWKDRLEKRFGSVFCAENFMNLYYLKPSSLSKASASIRNSLKKPPFFVPGRIVYNDSHLLQSGSQVKNPSTKKTVTRTGVVKAASSQFGAFKKPLGKIKPAATNMAESSKPTTDACPHCQVFIPSTVPQEVDDLHASSAKPLPQISAPNPFIAIDRRISAEKPFSSLLKSPESSTIPVSYPPEDGQDVDNSADCESKQQETHHEIVALAEAHQNKTSLRAESNSKGKGQELQEQEVFQNNDDGGIIKSESEVEKFAIQLAFPSDDEAEEDVHHHNLHAENIEIAQQLRAQIEEKKKLLDELCRKWNSRLKEGSIPNEEIGAVLTVIGQTQLLQRERIHQYAGLILKFENNNSDEKKILKSDLEGFWEMILLQVTDVENKFIELESLLGNGWTRQENVEFQLKKKQKGKPKKENVDKVYVNSSRIKSHIASLRKKQMESNSLTSADCVSYADQVTYSNPGEIAVTLPVIDKRNPTNQQEISTPSSLISADCFSCADNVSLSNPGEVAFTLPVIDKRSPPFIQPEISTPSKNLLNREIRQMNETRVTPNCIKLLRRKHKSGSTLTFFSSPHQTDSPRMRSHSANCMLDKPPVPTSSTKKIVPSNQLLEIPKIFSPTVKQLVTRSERISRSPERFGHTEERNSSYTDISYGLSPTIKLLVTRAGRVCRSPDRFGQTEEYVERNSVTSKHIGITTNKEENNNDMKDSFPAVNLPNCTRKI